MQHLQGNEAAAHEILNSWAESSAYNPQFIQSFAALIEGRFDAAIEHWRNAVLAHEPYAILNMRGEYSWRTTFPVYYESPGYQQMLVDFGLDDESISKITIPELPF